ncbi:hypothetical protein ACC763_37770, partial [Rhizobium ruizarguesonis]
IERFSLRHALSEIAEEISLERIAERRPLVIVEDRFSSGDGIQIHLVTRCTRIQFTIKPIECLRIDRTKYAVTGLLSTLILGGRVVDEVPSILLPLIAQCRI